MVGEDVDSYLGYRVSYTARNASSERVVIELGYGAVFFSLLSKPPSRALDVYHSYPPYLANGIHELRNSFSQISPSI